MTAPVKVCGNGTSTITSQFLAEYTGIGTFWPDRIGALTFDDGTSFDWEQIIKQLDSQAKSQIVTYGFSYDDTLDPGPGAVIRYLSGGNGNDTYVFDFGYAFDVVQDHIGNILSGSSNTIQFGANVRPQDVTFSRLGNSPDLVVTLSDGSTLWIKGEFDLGPAGIGYALMRMHGLVAACHAD